jgi:hypothetical protein
MLSRVAKLALVVAVVALCVAILAYQAAGGGRALQAHVRAVEDALASLRRWTADTFTRLARALRGGPEDPVSPRPAPPARR